MLSHSPTCCAMERRVANSKPTMSLQPQEWLVRSVQATRGWAGQTLAFPRAGLLWNPAWTFLL